MSGENLVIVESPAKARTIGKILGREYNIMASMGHVRDLPQHSFGVDINNNFEPRYEESKTRGRVLKDLRSAAKKANEIYLAPDPDREGEAIAWHLMEILRKNTKAQFHRVTFHEITRSAVNRAFEKPDEINLDRVNSQQARRILDRLVGYKISPLLWSRIRKGMSAGRVQTVALRLVCEREREIKDFTPKEYWNFNAEFEAGQHGSGRIFPAKLHKIENKKFDIDNGEDAQKILDAIRNASEDFRISSIAETPKNRYAPPPFITSTLQQAAGSLLRFSANFTMRVAQQLYEGVEIGSSGPTGLITYMRTDSFNIAAEARENCRKYIAENFGPDFVPEKPNFFKSRSGAQEAHEAIRPTDVTMSPEKVKDHLDPSQLKLYTLIWKRFTASQMAAAKLKQTDVEVSTRGTDKKEYTFRSSATVTVFPGFMKVYANDKKNDEKSDLSEIFRQLKENENCILKKLDSEQKFTEPPPHYSEATLIKELESNGIGRPSTYASIVNTIQKREYVLKDKGKLSPTELGFKVNDFLINSLPELFQVGFTAEMESRLDKIEDGKVDWTQMLRDFYSDFSIWLEDTKNIGSPEKAKAEGLISALNSIKNWEKPVKKGRRTYDDKKFFDSIKEKFEEGATVTARQWEALMNLAIKYSEQLPGLDRTASEQGFADELEAAKKSYAEARKRREETTASEDDKNKYAEIFSFFDNVQWEKPEKSKGRTYDDAKFFNSLKSQAEAGRILSEKQQNALARIASKYKEQIHGFDRLSELLKISKGETYDEESASSEKDPETEKMLDALSKVTEWAEPVKKGKRTYDDKAFFESLAEQYDKGRKLSPRQLYALKKVYGKYTRTSSGTDRPQE